MMTDMEYSRNERSISSWISMGSMEPIGGSGTSVPVPPDPAPPSPAPRLAMVCRYPFDFGAIPGTATAGARPSNVEEAHVLGIALDEVAPQFNVVAHEDGTHLVSHRRLLHCDLQQGTLTRVDGGVA